jgi:putative ABC transport system permease protein
MMLGETVAVALIALRANKLRSALTMLGIVIGVAAVIAVVALGRGAQQAVNDRITALGTTLLSVVPGQVFMGGIASSSDRARLPVDDATALQEQGTLFAAVEPEMARTLQVQWRRTNTSTSIIGATANYADVRKYTVSPASGRMFTVQEDEGRKRVAVLGATTANNLSPGAPNALIGEMIRISGIEFQVIGIFDPKGAAGFNDPDDQVVIPINTARFRVFDTIYLRTISVVAPSEAMIPETMTEIERILRRQHRIPSGRDDDFQIRSQADFLNTLSSTTQVFGLLLGGIAAVSLVVGGIGIMNIMLVSVTERTREIGVRKALGATKMIFGIILGAGGAIGMRYGFHWNTDVAPSSVVLAFVFSALVGVVFGVWPARRAAMMDPITALRYE